MSNLKKLMFFLAPLVLLTVFPLLSSAQMDSGGKMTVTGCVKAGKGGDGYYMMGQDGKMYELWGKGIGDHVNHTVTVMGAPAKMSHAQEEKKEASEKAEAGSANYIDLKVTSLKMVGETCQ
jgi:hypothetical protein